MQIMGIVNEERNGLLAAAHHFHERPLAFFWFAGQVTVFVRGQIVIQGQFEGAQRHPWDIEHERFGHLDLAFVPSLVLDTPQQQGFATPDDPG